MRFRKTPFVLALCLGLVAGVAACDDDGIVEPIDGTVTGTVSADGQPLPNVVLTLDGPINTSNATGTDGAYAFTDVPEGSYVVGIEVAPDEVAFDDTEKNVVVTAGSPDATATFDGTFTDAQAAR